LIVSDSGLETVADPSNVNLRFDRVRVRKVLPLLAEHALTAARLAETAERLGRAASALDRYALEFLQAHFRVDDLGVVSGRVEAFADVPEEIALRSLACLIRAVGGAEYTPRFDALEQLLAAVIAGDVKRTLSGAVVEVADGELVARREWGRDGPPDLTCQAGTTLIWDRRFRVEIPDVSGELQVQALGRSDRRLKFGDAKREAVKLMPGLYRGGELVGVPAGVEGPHGFCPYLVLKVKCLVGQRLGIGGTDSEEAA
jgi:tRNA(Ile)-lysidine synthase